MLASAFFVAILRVFLLDWHSNLNRRNCSMKLHIVGAGGRAHASVWKLAQLDYVTSIVCAPGNAGISMERLRNDEAVRCVPVLPTDIDGQLALARACEPHLTIVSEDEPLALGIVDLFQAAGLRIWGPNKRAARFEWSKVWAWEFMQRHGIPTPLSRPCDTWMNALVFAQSLNYECAIKLDGLARGKGVFICRTQGEVTAALCRIFLNREFGDAGKRVLVQKLVHGQELSLHFLCSGRSVAAFPSSKDHKRALEGDKGDMTGGMGTISPSPDINPADYEKLAKGIIRPWLKGCEAEGIDFRGVLYPGVMLADEGPVVLEFNARLGDPETQVYLTRLQNDLRELMDLSLDGCEFPSGYLKWSNDTSVCVVVTAPGYPGKYEREKKITGWSEAAEMPNVKIFHAGTAMKGDELVTNDGRVLGVTAWAPDLNEARRRAYRAANLVKLEGGQHFRRDIGGPILNVS